MGSAYLGPPSISVIASNCSGVSPGRSVIDGASALTPKRFRALPSTQSTISFQNRKSPARALSMAVWTSVATSSPSLASRASRSATVSGRYSGLPLGFPDSPGRNCFPSWFPGPNVPSCRLFTACFAISQSSSAWVSCCLYYGQNPRLDGFGQVRPSLYHLLQIGVSDYAIVVQLVGIVYIP